MIMRHQPCSDDSVLAVVGGGPMATYALERLAAITLAKRTARRLRIVVFERTGQFGSGQVHSETQPRTSLLNRVVGEIAFSADESNESISALLPPEDRRDFAAWCRSAPPEAENRVLRDRDYAPRQMHGSALREMFARYVSMLRSIGKVEVELYAAEVIDVRESESGRLSLVYDTGEEQSVEVDRVLFVTGHSYNNIALGDSPFDISAAHSSRYVRSVYPLERNVTFEHVPEGSRVGLLGFGLAAIDVMLHLTEGRGGSFTDTDLEIPRSGLRYRRSGREPASIVVVSSTGLPLLARAENFKTGLANGGAHRGVFLTDSTIDILRRRHGKTVRFGNGRTQRQLDFDRHILPVIALEMAYLYYNVLLGFDAQHRLRDCVVKPVQAFLRQPARDPWMSIDRLISPLERRATELAQTTADRAGWGLNVDWRSILDPSGHIVPLAGDSWARKVETDIVADLEAAIEGNIDNPLKAACDGVWRDLRGTIASVADRGGLTAESHRRFVRSHARTHNRLCNGPSVQAMRKVLALIQSGLVDISIGPLPSVHHREATGAIVVTGSLTNVVKEVDVAMEARVHPFHAAQDSRPLYPNLLRRGFARLWQNPAISPDEAYIPGALDVDERFHPYGADGRLNERITFLGAAIDGVVHLRLSLARPRSNSSVLNALNAWAEEALEAVFQTTDRAA